MAKTLGVTRLETLAGTTGAVRAHAVLEAAAVAGILALAVLFRFSHLRQYPGWYTDEGAFYNVAHHLMQGRWQYFALQGSPLLVGRPPLFFGVAAGALRVFGADLVTVRGLTAMSGAVSVLLLYLLGRAASGRGTALWSALLLALLPEAVAYSRIGFTYNLLAPLFLLTAGFVWKFVETRRAGWWLGACLAGGASLATDYAGLVAVILVGLAVFFTARQRLLSTALLLGLPLLLVLAPLVAASPRAVSSDLAFTFLRGGGSLPFQFLQLIIAYGETVRQVIWVPLGLVGLALLADRRARRLLLFLAAATLLFLCRAVLPFGHSFYYLIPLLPFLALGAGRLLHLGIGRALAWMQAEMKELVGRSLPPVFAGRLQNSLSVALTSGTVFLLLLSPLMWMALLDLQVFVFNLPALQQLGYVTHFTQGVSSPAEAQQVLDYLNKNAHPLDLVLASPQVAWGLKTRTADFLQLLAYEGEPAQALPELDPMRFAYPVGLDHAAYVVVDDLWRGWAARRMPALEERIERVEQWPLALEAGEFRVYRNPAN